jgi:diadenylate cyclase
MAELPHASMVETLALCAPGTPLRAGLDRILQARRGCLVVLSDDPHVLGVSTGGFLLDAEFTPQRLSELAKMDGAIVLARDAGRIARANVHLTPKASVPTSETGTRHRTAERVARSLGIGVITVSAAMSTISVFVGDVKRTLQPPARLIDRASQALATMQRFRERFDAGLAVLTTAEIGAQVSIDDVVDVLQPAAIMARIADEVAEELVELGFDGRLIALQLSELVGGVESSALGVVADYVMVADERPTVRAVEVWGAMRSLGGDDIHSGAAYADLLAIGGSPEEVLSSRGYRALQGVPRLSGILVERLVARFGSFTALRQATTAELESVEGVGSARASSIKAVLGRLGESNGNGR